MAWLRSTDTESWSDQAVGSHPDRDRNGRDAQILATPWPLRCTAAEGWPPCWSRATTAATVTVVRYSVVGLAVDPGEMPTSVTGPGHRPEGAEQARGIGQGVERQ